MIVQAWEYEQRQPGLDLSDFFDSTRGKFLTDYVRGLVRELEAERDNARSNIMGCNK